MEIGTEAEARNSGGAEFEDGPWTTAVLLVRGFLAFELICLVALPVAAMKTDFFGFGGFGGGASDERSWR